MKRKIVALIVSVVLASGAGFALASCAPASTIPSGVKEITSSKQKSGNVTFTNYQTILNEDVDWDGQSTDQKQAIINYAYNEALKIAEEDGVRNFNILGVIDGGGGVVFMYDHENNNMIVYSGGKPAGTLPVPESAAE
ncbi:MAG: hypothetical protein FWG24_06010 [Eggerthellaceae bacterium]|nr:hypothetical protein [Eggerthellaceae bacterium]